MQRPSKVGSSMHSLPHLGLPGEPAVAKVAPEVVQRCSSTTTQHAMLIRLMQDSAALYLQNQVSQVCLLVVMLCRAVQAQEVDPFAGLRPELHLADGSGTQLVPSRAEGLQLLFVGAAHRTCYL